MQTMGDRLRLAREKKFSSKSQAANALGVHVSTYRAHENGQNEYGPTEAAHYGRKFGVSAAWLLTGDPALTPSLISSYDPDIDGDSEQDHTPTEGAAIIDGKLFYNRKYDGGSPETSATPGAGYGTDDGVDIKIGSKGIATGHEVIDEWRIPPTYMRHGLGGHPSQILIMPVVGHSMRPMLEANDRVIVDVSQNTWIGDAVYVIDDGDKVLQVKTVKKVTSSNPPLFRVISESDPASYGHEPLRADQFHIVGRVVGRISKM